MSSSNKHRKLIKKTIVGTIYPNKDNLLNFLINLVNDFQGIKNHENLKSSFLNSWQKSNSKYEKENFFLSVYGFGIWDNDYNLNRFAKRVAKNNDSFNARNYLDIFILNYVININNRSYNPLICLLKYLKSNEEIITSGIIKLAIEEWTNTDSFNERIADDLRLLFASTNYFKLKNGKLFLVYNLNKLLKKCNYTYHDEEINKFEKEISDWTKNSTYLLKKNYYSNQKIYYGSPGTGKSYNLEKDSKNYFFPENIKRITFHPSYSYSSFVGLYKPIKNRQNKTVFDFIPGILIDILIEAYQNPNENYLLIIEEINRSNVSEVFGDFFQLIERDKEGKSQYEINVSDDLKKYLKKKISPNIDKLYFPSNLYIWATMNSSDQGTFPLDTAFKRRWDFEYIGIDDNAGDNDDINKILFKLPGDDESIKWNNFRKSINEILLEINSTINEDKLLGPFFIGGNLNDNDPEDNTEIIKNKVVPYLYEDVLKYLGRDAINKIFNSKLKNLSQIISEFDKENAKFTDVFSFSNKEIEDNANNSNSNNNATTESQDN